MPSATRLPNVLVWYYSLISQTAIGLTVLGKAPSTRRASVCNKALPRVSVVSFRGSLSHAWPPE